MPTDLDDLGEVSLETIDQIDADLVFYSSRSALPFAELDSIPTWSVTDAQRDGRVWEVSNAWNQSGWFGTLSVIDDLAVIAEEYRAIVDS